MTETHSPLDVALDLLIYAPLGLALTAAEEIPKLAAKGRSQVGGQVAMAKVVGQFAVAQGRKELQKRFSPPAKPDRPAPASAPGRPSSPGRDADPAAGDVTFEDLLANSEPDNGSGDGQTVSADAGKPAAGDSDAGKSVADQPSPTGLAIPGYDSLAASQVVQRLAGLSAAELAAVGAYESAHRGRRTILTRIRQLQDH